MSEFSRETLLNIIETDHVQCGEASALARIALAAMDSESGCLPLDYLQGHKDGLEWAAQLAEANHPETGDWLYDDPIELAKAIRKGPDMPPAQPAADSEPVALQPELAKVIYHFRDWNEGFPVERFKADYVISWMLANYPPMQPAKDREQVRREHAEWSQATFGNVGPVGPLKHLSKEALEAAAEPGDLSEWADMQFLLWDAQRRAGITDEQITQAMIEKLAVNKQRKWPEPKDGEPRLHIKEQPAPVVLVIPDEMTSGQAYEIGYYYGDPVDVFARGANWMRQHIIDSTLAAAPQLPGSDPATVPGKWIPVSERMPENDGAYLCWDNRYVTTYAFIFGAWQANQFIAKNITHWMPLPAGPQEVR
ncbi:TPA: dATP/dGTP pyrophosphohydrolase domain-containing protein [Klebsiella pneumoniae]